MYFRDGDENTDVGKFVLKLQMVISHKADHLSTGRKNVETMDLKWESKEGVQTVELKAELWVSGKHEGSLEHPVRAWRAEGRKMNGPVAEWEMRRRQRPWLSGRSSKGEPQGLARRSTGRTYKMCRDKGAKS